MTTMNRQEIFNTIATHLLTQNARSHDPSARRAACRYRDGQGHKCAIGVFIPDDKYDTHLEEFGVMNVHLETVYLDGEPKPVQNRMRPILMEAFKCDSFSESDDTFLYLLQKIHDAESILNWPYVLRKFAIAHGLEVPRIVEERLAILQ